MTSPAVGLRRMTPGPAGSREHMTGIANPDHDPTPRPAADQAEGLRDPEDVADEAGGRGEPPADQAEGERDDEPA